MIHPLPLRPPWGRRSWRNRQARPHHVAGERGAHLDAEERVLLDLLNQVRIANGKPPFWALSARLTQAADWHSRDMFRTGIVSHTSSNGWYIGERLAWFGWNNVLFSQPAGEIIYSGSGSTSIASAASAVQSWMTSAPHRTAILNAKFAHIGIGRAANAAGTTAFWTVDFSAQSPFGTSIDDGVIRPWDLGFIDPDTP